MTIKVVTDSTSYIPESLKSEYDISIVSLSVIFGDEVYKEVDITNQEFYQKLDKVKKIPTSSQPTVNEFYNIFEENIKQNKDIVGVFISSKMSGTLSTAKLAKDMILEKYLDAKIELIDSKSNCLQLGFAVLEAAKAAKEGKSFVEVVKKANNNIKRSRFIFTPDTLEYLKMGGRIGTASALVGSVLKIKPILTVTNGETNLLKKVRTKKRALEELIDMFLEDINKFGLGDVIVHHINIEDEARKIATIIEKKIGKTVNIYPIGPVIGTHVGPGAIGIAYYTRDELKY